MRSKQDALEFHSVGKEDLLNKSPINRRRVSEFLSFFTLADLIQWIVTFSALVFYRISIWAHWTLLSKLEPEASETRPSFHTSVRCLWVLAPHDP